MGGDGPSGPPGRKRNRRLTLVRNGEGPRACGRAESGEAEALPRPGASGRPLFCPSRDLDTQLDRYLARTMGDWESIEAQVPPSASQAFLNACRLVARRPRELLVFCTTASDSPEGTASWGDIFALTDPPDTFRYLFTVYTTGYVEHCERDRGERIRETAEDIILSAPRLTGREVVRALWKWTNRYYPMLKGVPVRLENADTVRQLLLVP